MATRWPDAWVGARWTGSGELWVAPEGNKADRCDCEMRLEADALHYSWSYEGKPQEGSFVFDEGGATWSDTWHQKETAKCPDVAGARGLFTVEHSYTPDPPPWRWRSKLSERPNGDLVLQMTNLSPWGEEGRAVRMIFTRVD